MVSLFWWQCHRDTVIQCSAEQDNFSKATSSDNLSPIKSINYTSYGNKSIYLRNYESKSENCSWFRYGISCRMRSFAFGSNVVFRKWLRPATGSLSSRLVTSIKLIISGHQIWRMQYDKIDKNFARGFKCNCLSVFWIANSKDSSLFSVYERQNMLHVSYSL